MLVIQITVEDLSLLIQSAVQSAISELQLSMQSSNINLSERLTIAQLVGQYKISKATIHNLKKSGKLAFEKIGRKTLFMREDVEAYFNSKKQQLNKTFGATCNSIINKSIGKKV